MKYWTKRLMIFMKYWIRRIAIQLEYYFHFAIALITAPYWVPRMVIEYKKSFGGSFNGALTDAWNRLTKEEQDQWMTETMRKIINFKWV